MGEGCGEYLAFERILAHASVNPFGCDIPGALWNGWDYILGDLSVLRTLNSGLH